MKPASRLRIDTEAIADFLAQIALGLAKLLTVIGFAPMAQEFLSPFATQIKRCLFLRACAEADRLGALRGVRRLYRLHHKHAWISTRAIMRAMLARELRNLATGDDRTRILRLQAVLAKSDAIVAAMTRTILRKTGTFNLRRLIYAPPRTLTLAAQRPLQACAHADTS